MFHHRKRCYCVIAKFVGLAPGMENTYVL